MKELIVVFIFATLIDAQFFPGGGFPPPPPPPGWFPGGGGGVGGGRVPPPPPPPPPPGGMFPGGGGGMFPGGGGGIGGRPGGGGGVGGGNGGGNGGGGSGGGGIGGGNGGGGIGVGPGGGGGIGVRPGGGGGVGGGNGGGGVGGGNGGGGVGGGNGGGGVGNGNGGGAVGGGNGNGNGRTCPGDIGTDGRPEVRERWTNNRGGCIGDFYPGMIDGADNKQFCERALIHDTDSRKEQCTRCFDDSVLKDQGFPTRMFDNDKYTICAKLYMEDKYAACLPPLAIDQDHHMAHVSVGILKFKACVEYTRWNALYDECIAEIPVDQEKNLQLCLATADSCRNSYARDYLRNHGN